jgi:hypothetical protein
MKNAAFFWVEDEALLRMMTAEMLEELGHPRQRSIWRFSTLTSAVNHHSNCGNYCRSRAAIHIRQRLRFGGRPQSFQDRPALRKPFLIESLVQIIEKALSDRPGVT